MRETDYVPFWTKTSGYTRWDPAGKPVVVETRLRPNPNSTSFTNYLISSKGPVWLHPPDSAWLVLAQVGDKLLVECLSELGRGLRYKIPNNDPRFTKASVIEYK